MRILFVALMALCGSFAVCGPAAAQCENTFQGCDDDPYGDGPPQFTLGEERSIFGLVDGVSINSENSFLYLNALLEMPCAAPTGTGVSYCVINLDGNSVIDPCGGNAGTYVGEINGNQVCRIESAGVHYYYDTTGFLPGGWQRVTNTN